MSNRTRILIAAGILLALLLWLAVRFSSREQWQQFSGAELWNTLTGANGFYLALGTALTFGSYLCRSFRWQIFLKPMKATSLRGIFAATLVGFAAVALASRAGEIVRPWLIARKENLPLSSQLGAWTLERIFDILMLVGLLGLALWSIPPPESGGVSSALLGAFRTAGWIFTGIAVLLAAVLAQLRYFPRITASLLGFFAQPLPESYRGGIRRVVEHFSATVAAIEGWRSFVASLGWTAAVWLTLLGAYWSAAQALGPPLSQLPLAAMVLLMSASVVGSIAYIPGIGGGTQVATTLTLVELFRIPLTYATGMALTVWTMTYLLVVVPGLPLAFGEGLSWGRLRRLMRGESESSVPSRMRQE